MSDQGVQTFDGADGVALHDMPHRHAQFARHCDGRFVTTPAHGHGQAPLLQRVSYLQELFGRLYEQSADRSAAMAFEGRAPFPLPALLHTGIKAKVSAQFARIIKAADVADSGDQSVKGNQTDATEASETKQLFFSQDLLRHVVTQLLAPSARADQANMELSKQHLLRISPFAAQEQSSKRRGMTQAKTAF